MHIYQKFEEKLKAAGIELNSALNGVYLPTKAYVGRTGALHTGGHITPYYEYIQMNLLSLSDPAEIRAFVATTKEQLSTRQLLLQNRDSLLYQPVKPTNLELP